MSAVAKDAFFQQHMALVAAAGKLYYAGVWALQSSDTSTDEQKAMWEALRDALGLKPGSSTDALGLKP